MTETDRSLFQKDRLAIILAALWCLAPLIPYALENL